ncbi:hypothetical protein SK3146_02391 [Paenibacillus konkukensis]|uniref:Uncharacterized protein n=1 Tax=Paenibacillus konkukensis TaxID=2020716 RepID=A0ABY4RMR5_9BACL|nr:hypothetical protein SK3146_02391 [Paenibacillus konkukensis]
MYAILSVLSQIGLGTLIQVDSFGVSHIGNYGGCQNGAVVLNNVASGTGNTVHIAITSIIAIHTL